MARRPPERTMGAAVSALSAGLAVPGSGLGQSMYGLPADAPRISFIAVDDISANPQQPRRSIDARNQEELVASAAHQHALEAVMIERFGQPAARRFRVLADLLPDDRNMRGIEPDGHRHNAVVKHLVATDLAAGAASDDLGVGKPPRQFPPRRRRLQRRRCGEIKHEGDVAIDRVG